MKPIKKIFTSDMSSFSNQDLIIAWLQPFKNIHQERPRKRGITCITITKEEPKEKNVYFVCFSLTFNFSIQIFMKFETFVHKIIPPTKFYKDPRKVVRARGENARTCDALQRFRSESKKSRKCVFRPFLNRHQEELFFSNF